MYSDVPHSHNDDFSFDEIWVSVAFFCCSDPFRGCRFCTDDIVEMKLNIKYKYSNWSHDVTRGKLPPRCDQTNKPISRDDATEIR